MHFTFLIVCATFIRKSNNSVVIITAELRYQVINVSDKSIYF